MWDGRFGGFLGYFRGIIPFGGSFLGFLSGKNEPHGIVGDPG